MLAMPLTLSELDQIRERCHALVNQRALASAAIAVIPLPGLDLGADVAIMTRMIALINEQFGLTPEALNQLEPNTREKMLVIISSLGSSMIGKFISKEMVILWLKRAGARFAAKQAAKIVPILGTVTAAGISYGTMRMLGHAHIDDCYTVLRRSITAG